MDKYSVDKEIKTLLRNLICLKKHNSLTKEKMSEILKISTDVWEEVESEKLPTSLTVDIFYIVKEKFGIEPSDMIHKELENAMLPPSDEGGGFCEAKDGGREVSS